MFFINFIEIQINLIIFPILDGNLERLLLRNKIFAIFFVLLNFFSFAQTKIQFHSPFLRDVIFTDNYIFTAHLLEDTGLNITGKAFIYKLNHDLIIEDSLILDSVAVFKVINYNQHLYITASRNYADGITRSILFYRCDYQLNILSKKEVKETGTDFSAQSFNIPQDSLKILTQVKRIGGNRYLFEWTTDTLFSYVDTNSCKLIINGNNLFYFQQATHLNDKNIYSGLLENAMEPMYYQFNENGLCAEFSPFAIWQNTIFSETGGNYELYTGKHTNQILQHNQSLLIPSSAEQVNGQMNSIGNIFKTDFTFNLDTFCIIDPGLFSTHVTPFRCRSISITENKYLFALNTNADVLDANPNSPNEILIYILDSNLTILNHHYLNPFNTTNDVYYGTHLVTFNDTIYMCGTITDFISPDRSFIVKYRSISEVLNISHFDKDNSVISFYPNPSADIIYFHTDLSEFKNVSYCIYSSNGEIIIQKPLTENKIDIRALPSGKYVMQINSAKIHLTGCFLKMD